MPKGFQTKYEPYFCGMQLSQAKKKWIRALGQKKFRDEQKLFVAEGEKVIADLLRGGAVPRFVLWEENRKPAFALPPQTETAVCDDRDMRALSSLAKAPGVLAVFPQWTFDPAGLHRPNPRWLVADGIKDPGNLGTLIRTAHWFGVHALVAVNGCAELYNPKTIQSTMGSLGRLPVYYPDASAFFDEFADKVLFFGADLDGEPLQDFGAEPSFALVIGSESHGLSAVAAARLSRKVFIPAFDTRNRPESLNAAVSAGIILSRIAAGGA